MKLLPTEIPGVECMTIEYFHRDKACLVSTKETPSRLTPAAGMHDNKQSNNLTN